MIHYVLISPKDSEPQGTPFCICAKDSEVKHGIDTLIANVYDKESGESLIKLLNSYEELKKTMKKLESFYLCPNPK